MQASFALPIFFAFLGLRASRLVPALKAEVFLCARLVGPLLTALPLAAYFSDQQFWSYFLNIVGHIQFLLPGVFRDTPFFEAVNVSLWTVPYELECCLALTALPMFGLIHRPAFC